MFKTNVSPSTLAVMLERAQDGDEFVLDPGEYQGPLTIGKAVVLRGSGATSIIWSGDEPALHIAVLGVCVENLTIERSVGWEDQPVIVVAPGCEPSLKDVYLKGQALNVVWAACEWDLAEVNLGQICQGESLETQVRLQIGSLCQINCQQKWLQLGNNQLSPGLHNLPVHVKITPDIPPGSHLVGEITFVPTDGTETRVCKVVAEISGGEQPLEVGNPHQAFQNKEPLKDVWHFNFTRSAAERFLDFFNREEEVSSQNKGMDPRDQAKDLYLDFCGQRAVWYVRRREAQDSNDEYWVLSLATDINQKIPQEWIEKHKTLSVDAALSRSGKGALRFTRIRLVPADEGCQDGNTVPVSVRWQKSFSYSSSGGVSQEVMDLIQQMPFIGSVRPTSEQRRMWDAFLKIEEKLAEKRQFCVPIDQPKQTSLGKIVSLVAQSDKALVVPDSEETLELQEFWYRLKRAKNETVEYFKQDPKNADRQGLELGTIESWSEEKDLIRIRLSDDMVCRLERGLDPFTDEGWIVFTAYGDLAQVKRKRQGMKDLEKGKIQNPFLAEFLFDSTQAREPHDVISLTREELLDPSKLNISQKQAVEKALAAPDLMLVQGPPGTGKTTVIAEICYQIALRGGRTLIASQSNLAVDNALSRLVTNPKIRALRKGRADSVEEEGLPYLEEYVINTWLTGTADNCEHEIHTREENIRLFHDLLDNTSRFANYLEREESFAVNSLIALSRHEALIRFIQEKDGQVEDLQIEKLRLSNQLLELRKFSLYPESLNSSNIESAKFIEDLLSLLSKDSSSQDFIIRYEEVLGKATKLRLKPSNISVFQGLAWLRSNVLSEYQSAQKWRLQLQESLDMLKTAHDGEAHTKVVQREISRLISDIKLKEREFSQTQKNMTVLQVDIQILTEQIIRLDDLQDNLLLLLRKKLTKSLDQGKFDDFTGATIIATISPDWLQDKVWYQELVLACMDEISVIRSRGQEIVSQRTYISQKSANLQRMIKTGIDRIPEMVRQEAVLPNQRRTNFQFKKTLISAWRIIQRLLWTPPYKQFQTSKLSVLNANDLNELELWSEAFESRIQLAHNWANRFRPVPINWCWDIEEVNDILKQKRQFDSQFDKVSLLGVQLQDSKINHLHRQCNEVHQKLTARLKTLLTQARQAACNNEALIGEQLHELEQEIRQKGDNIKDKETQQINLLNRSVAIQHQATQALGSFVETIPVFLSDLLQGLLRGEIGAVEFTHQFEAIVKDLDNLYAKLQTLNPVFLIGRAEAVIQHESERIDADLMSALEEQTKFREELATSEVSLLEIDRTWWAEVWEAIPSRLRPPVPPDGLNGLGFLRGISMLFASWHRELEREENYLKRYQQLVSGWIERLRKPTSQDATELRQIYLDNANVIGITCSQAATRRFNEEFRYFDVVIVDEVSKATPPELVLPALKGRKVILIGDHRQLPPMLEDSTITELSDELNLDRDDVSFLKESLFKQLFESASDGISQMLNIQYRMHPSIMNSVNQFYDHQLRCGIFNPDIARAHGFNSENFPVDRHLAWISLPITPDFYEQQVGYSYSNPTEIEIIESILREMEAAWAPRVAEGQKPKEIALITFYLPQYRLLRNAFQGNKEFPSLSLRLGTVDRFQGMEREVVIVSTVRNNSQGKVGFAKEPERVNVALSRAQQLLVVVGCHELFENYGGHSPYKNVTKAVRQAGGFVDVSRFLV